MRSQFAFTEDALKGIRAEAKKSPPTKRQVYKDTRKPGLILRVEPSKRMVFYIHAWITGKQRTAKLGTWPETPIRIARSLVDEQRRRFGGWGEQAQAREFTKVTLNEAFRHYLEMAQVIETTKTSREGCYNRHIKHRLGSKFLHEILPIDIQAVAVAALRKVSPRTVIEIRSIINQVYKHADKAQWLPGRFDVPTKKVDWPTKTAARRRRLSAKEFGPFLKAVDEFGTIQFLGHGNSTGHRRTVADCILCLLWTGQRSGEVKGMRWEEVDFDAKAWTIPDTAAQGRKKTGGKTIALDDQTLEILWRRKAAAKSGYVFPGHGGKGCLKDIGKTFAAICEAAKIKDLRPHDLRRTQGSVQNGLGVSLKAVAEGLGHHGLDSVDVYTWADGLGELRDNRNRANRAILAMAGEEYEGTVRPDAMTAGDWQRIIDVLGESGHQALAAKLGPIADMANLAG